MDFMETQPIFAESVASDNDEDVDSCENCPVAKLCDGDTEFSIFHGDNFVGRSGENQSDTHHVQLLNPGVSGRHAIINVDKDLHTIRDVGSTNGTQIKSSRLKPNVAYQLLDGCKLRFGDTWFRYVILHQTEETETETDDNANIDVAKFDRTAPVWNKESDTANQSYDPFLTISAPSQVPRTVSGWLSKESAARRQSQSSKGDTQSTQNSNRQLADCSLEDSVLSARNDSVGSAPDGNGLLIPDSQSVDVLETAGQTVIDSANDNKNVTAGTNSFIDDSFCGNVSADDVKESTEAAASRPGSSHTAAGSTQNNVPSTDDVLVEIISSSIQPDNNTGVVLETPPFALREGADQNTSVSNVEVPSTQPYAVDVPSTQPYYSAGTAHSPNTSSASSLADTVSVPSPKKGSVILSPSRKLDTTPIHLRVMPSLFEDESEVKEPPVPISVGDALNAIPLHLDNAEAIPESLPLPGLDVFGISFSSSSSSTKTNAMTEIPRVKSMRLSGSASKFSDKKNNQKPRKCNVEAVTVVRTCSQPVCSPTKTLMNRAGLSCQIPGPSLRRQQSDPSFEQLDTAESEQPQEQGSVEEENFEHAAHTRTRAKLSAPKSKRRSAVSQEVTDDSSTVHGPNKVPKMEDTEEPEQMASGRQKAKRSTVARSTARATRGKSVANAANVSTAGRKRKSEADGSSASAVVSESGDQDQAKPKKPRGRPPKRRQTQNSPDVAMGSPVVDNSGDNVAVKKTRERPKKTLDPSKSTQSKSQSDEVKSTRSRRTAVNTSGLGSSGTNEAKSTSSATARLRVSSVVASDDAGEPRRVSTKSGDPSSSKKTKRPRETSASSSRTRNSRRVTAVPQSDTSETPDVKPDVTRSASKRRLTEVKTAERKPVLIFCKDAKAVEAKSPFYDITEDPKDADILVSNELHRSVKVLSAIARGIPIVTVDFVKNLKAVPTMALSTKHAIHDSAFETKFGFRLSATLHSAAAAPLLSGYSVYATKNVQPPPADVKLITVCASGLYATTWQSARSCENLLVVTTVEDVKKVPAWVQSKKGVVVMDTEGFMRAILKHSLAIEQKYLLSATQQPTGSSARSTRGNKK